MRTLPVKSLLQWVVRRISDSLNSTRSIRNFLSAYGWQALIGRAVRKMLYPFYAKEEIVFLKAVPNAMKPLESSLNIIELNTHNIEQMQTIMFVSRKKLHQRFENRHRCFAAVGRDRILSFCWVMQGIRYVRELDLTFQLRPDQAWMYNAATQPDARGQGLYPAILQRIMESLSTDGVLEFYIDVKKVNQSSLRGTRKSGAQDIAIVQLIRTLGIRRYTLEAIERSMWNQLSAQVIESPKGRPFSSGTKDAC